MEKINLSPDINQSDSVGDAEGKSEIEKEIETLTKAVEIYDKQLSIAENLIKTVGEASKEFEDSLKPLMKGRKVEPTREESPYASSGYDNFHNPYTSRGAFPSIHYLLGTLVDDFKRNRERLAGGIKNLKGE